MSIVNYPSDVNGYDEMSGKEFNEMYPDADLIKLTNIDEIHNGFAFNDGLNIDTEEFVPKICLGGGFHFVERQYACRWIHYGIWPIAKTFKTMIHMRKVIIPNDAKVLIQGDFVIKSDKIILEPRKEIDRSIYMKSMQIGRITLEMVPMHLRDIDMQSIKHEEYYIL